MADITMINHYANPAFNAKEEALAYFSKETVDQYKGFNRQLEQMKYETETSLKESVFDHYTEFIGFSEEIQKMDDSMEQLKKNLNRTFKLLDNLKDTSLTVENEEIEEIDEKKLVIPDNLAWIKTVNDDIDLFIFQRRFSEAVEECIRAQNELTLADTASNPLLKDLQVKLSAKADILAKKLVSELFSTESSRSDGRRVCRLLCGLGRQREASLLYLERASQEIQNHHRLVKPCGSIASLIEGLSDLFFECLQDTIVNYQGLFGSAENHGVFNICINWVTKEITEFVQQIVTMAIGDTVSTDVSADAFISFATCIAPLLRGAAMLRDVGCTMDATIVKIIGEKVKIITEGFWRTILVNIKSLPKPTLSKTTISFKSHIGLETRTVSEYCSAVYTEIAPFIQYCPQLLVPSLLPYITQPLIIGYEAFCSYVSKVYEKWVKDPSVLSPGLLITDLYFFSMELIPYIYSLFVPRMSKYSTKVAAALNTMRNNMKGHTMILFQKICNEFMKTTQFTPLFYISIFPHDFMETPVSAPTAEVVTAIRRVCMIVREAERSMPPSSFNVMKKALFTSIFTVISKSPQWQNIGNGEFHEDGFNAFALDCSFIQELAPSSVKSVCDGVIEKARALTMDIGVPSTKWLSKCMSDALKLCRKLYVCYKQMKLMILVQL